MTSASDILKKISNSGYEEDIPIETIEKLTDEASQQGDVRAMYLRAKIHLHKVKQLNGNLELRDKMLDETRLMFMDAALNGSVCAAYDLASQEASYLSNDSIETLAYNGLIEGEETLTFMITAYENESDFTSFEDVKKKAIRRSEELREIMRHNGVNELISGEYDIDLYQYIPIST